MLSSWDGVRYYQAPGLTIQPVRLSSRSTFVCASGHKASPSMANKMQQVSAPGARRLTWCSSRVMGPDGCDGRNGRQRPRRAAWESSRSGHLIYPGPAGKRKEEREPRVKKKRKPDVGSAHASTLRPAPQFPSVRLRMLGGHGRTHGPSPPNTPGLGYPAEPFLLTTLRGHDPQWARCTGTVTASSLPTPL